MRRLIGALALGLVGPSLGWGLPAAEAADSCSLTGTYAVDGLGEAAGFLEAVGTLTFTPNPACTGGTVGGSITIRHQGQPPASFTPAGTYSVTSAGAVTLTLPGVIDLVGVISLEGGGGTTANSVHLGAAFTAPQVFSVTGTRTPPLVGVQDLTCPPDAVRSGPTCVDKYEASVWSVPAANTALIKKVQQGTATLADLTAGGATQVSPSNPCSPAFPSSFPETGNWTAPLYAASVAGVPPTACVTWFQAEQACRLSGKRLLTNQEWSGAAAGTVDPGANDGLANTKCNTAATGPRATGLAGATPGGSDSCISNWDVQDMVGNLNEWVADWVPPASIPPCAIALFAGDFNCLAGMTQGAGTAALLRGGGWFNGSNAGVFSVNGLFTPSNSDSGIGLRCAR